MAAADTLSPYIEFKDVSKAFGKVVVLQNVNFEVLPGEMVCILGRSGVGKSVSLHNIMGFLKPDSGRVIVASQDITDVVVSTVDALHDHYIVPALEAGAPGNPRPRSSEFALS